MYDVIVIGARCAGSPTAMLLARQGYRVLMVDKATFPSDTMSSHFIQVPGIAHLKRWGLLDKLLATDCPPVARYCLDLGPFSLTGCPPHMDDVNEAYAPRRTVLDKILLDAAVEAGAEPREGFLVQEVLLEGSQVVGISGRTKSGTTVVERARLVIGADGMHSLVARTVGAPAYNDKPGVTCVYYTYWSGASVEGIELYPRERRMIIAFPTNDGLVCTFMEWPRDEFHAVRADIDRHYQSTLDLAPGLAARLRGGKRAERFVGTADLPNFFRKPHGPGWALVGDAGYYSDPYGAHGISDAFRDSELLVRAIDDGFRGRRPLEEALSEYERQRNDLAGPIYELNFQLATLQPPPLEMQQLFGALRGNQVETDRLFGALVGTVPIPEFFSPENIQRILSAAASDM